MITLLYTINQSPIMNNDSHNKHDCFNEPTTRKERKKDRKAKTNGKTGKYSQKHVRLNFHVCTSESNK